VSKGRINTHNNCQ